MLAPLAYLRFKSQKMNLPFPWSTTPELPPRLEALGAVAEPYSVAEDGAGVTNVEDEARSRIHEWVAVVVNKPICTTKGEVLEADEADAGSAGKIMTSPNGIATPL